MQISSNSSSLTTPFPSPRANATVGGSPPAEALPTKIKQVSDIPADPQSQRKLESSEPAWLDGPMTEAADAVPRWLAAARTRSGSETDSEVARKATFCGAVAGWNDSDVGHERHSTQPRS
jgi:hypothetical protein